MNRPICDVSCPNSLLGGWWECILHLACAPPLLSEPRSSSNWRRLGLRTGTAARGASLERRHARNGIQRAAGTPAAEQSQHRAPGLLNSQSSAVLNNAFVKGQ